MKKFFVDSHVHLNMKDFKDDFDTVLDRAKRKGVKYFLNIGFNLSSSLESVKLAKEFPFIFASVGFHPHDAKEFREKDLLIFEKLIRENKKILAIGEIGLDYFRDLSPRDIQKKVFIRQIEFAIEMNLPIVIHERDAFPDVLDVLRKFKGKVRGVFHCFNHDHQRIREVIRMGFYVGIGGVLTYPKNEKLREAVKFAPIERILLETDAPYLPPQGKRGKRNEPSFMIITAEKLSEIKGISIDLVMDKTTSNFENLFDIKLN